MRILAREICGEPAIYDYWHSGWRNPESHDYQALRTQWARGIVSGSILVSTFERQEKHG